MKNLAAMSGAMEASKDVAAMAVSKRYEGLLTVRKGGQREGSLVLGSS